MQFWIAKGKDQAANGPYSLAQVQKMIDNNKWRAAWLVSQDGAPYLPFEEAFQKQLAAKQLVAMQQRETKKQEEKRWREEQSAEASLQQAEEAADRRRNKVDGGAQVSSSHSVLSDSQNDEVPRREVSSPPAVPPTSAAATPLGQNPFASNEAAKSPVGGKRGERVTHTAVVRRQAQMAFRAGVALSIVGRLFLIINVVIWSGAMLLYGGGMMLSVAGSLWSEDSSDRLALAGAGLFVSLIWFCGWLISFLAAITIPLSLIAFGSFVASRTAGEAEGQD